MVPNHDSWRFPYRICTNMTRSYSRPNSHRRGPCSFNGFCFVPWVKLNHPLPKFFFHIRLKRADTSIYYFQTKLFYNQGRSVSGISATNLYTIYKYMHPILIFLNKSKGSRLFNIFTPSPLYQTPTFEHQLQSMGYQKIHSTISQLYLDSLNKQIKVYMFSISYACL